MKSVNKKQTNLNSGKIKNNHPSHIRRHLSIFFNFNGCTFRIIIYIKFEIPQIINDIIVH